jgi:hypothetical protein
MATEVKSGPSHPNKRDPIEGYKDSWKIMARKFQTKAP